MARMLEQRVKDLESEENRFWDELHTVHDKIAHIADGLASAIVRSKGLRITAMTTTPGAPVQDEEAVLYVKGGKLIVRYDDGGTARYKYLDLAGTGITWAHATVEP